MSTRDNPATTTDTRTSARRHQSRNKCRRRPHFYLSPRLLPSLRWLAMPTGSILSGAHCRLRAAACARSIGVAKSTNRLELARCAPTAPISILHAAKDGSRFAIERAGRLVNAYDLLALTSDERN